MKSYPLTGPPSAPGIYIIKNKTIKRVYAGQSVDLRRRYLEWRAIFSSRLGATNPTLHEAITTSNIEDWEFVVFELCEVAELNQREQEVISALRAGEYDCINGTEPKIPRKVTSLEGSTALSEVIDEDGQPMTRAQIAARCGVTAQSVKKRLAAWRRKGKIKIRITDLL